MTYTCVARPGPANAMIVKCEQCQTKFKIPDDKVTDKGVKVRCTKCSHTFRVTKESAAAGGSASGVFAAAGPAPSSGGVTVKVPAPKPVTLDSADPFSKFGQSTSVPRDEQTRPGVFVLGLEASKMPDLGRPAPAPPAAPPPAPPPVPATAKTSPFDFGSLTPPGAPNPAPAPPPGGAVTAPFDFAALMGPPSAGQPGAPGAPAKPAGGPAPFDFSALTAPAPPPETPASSPPPLRASAPARPIDAPAMSFDFSSLGPPPGAGAAPPPAAAPASMLPDLLDGPPPGASPAAATSPGMPPALGDDFFAAAPTQSQTGPLPSVPETASKEEARNALFDMAAAAPPAAPVPVAPAPEPAAATEAPPFSSSPSGAAPVPRPPDPATERGRRALGIVVNVVIAAVLVVGLVVVGTATVNEGKLDMQSIVTSLKGLVTPASEFPADDISNGLYETKMGRPVFFVRGVVANRSQGATRVKVRAEILDGASLVRSAEVVAGAPPSPEELFRLNEATELKALMERSSTKAPVVESGAEVPFLVTFAEYPPDLKDFRVRVTASPEGQPAAAANP